MAKISNILATISDIYQIGFGAGIKTLRLFNGFNGDLLWNPTDNRQVNLPDASGDLILADSPLLSGYVRLYSDFVHTAGDFVAVTSGTNSSFLYDTDTTNGRPGIITCNLGTTFTNYARIMHPNSGGGTNNIRLGQGNWLFSASLRPVSLSTTSDNYLLHIGFFDLATSALPVDGVLFRYNGAENSGKIQCITSNNSVRTIVDSGISMIAGAYNKYEIRINAAGTSALFFIDNALITEITTNIPTAAGRETSVGILGAKTSGTLGQSYQVDYMEVLSKLTTKR